MVINMKNKNEKNFLKKIYFGIFTIIFGAITTVYGILYVKGVIKGNPAISFVLLSICLILVFINLIITYRNIKTGGKK